MIIKALIKPKHGQMLYMLISIRTVVDSWCETLLFPPVLSVDNFCFELCLQRTMHSTSSSLQSVLWLIAFSLIDTIAEVKPCQHWSFSLYVGLAMSSGWMRWNGQIRQNFWKLLNLLGMWEARLQGVFANMIGSRLWRSMMLAICPLWISLRIY